MYSTELPSILCSTINQSLQIEIKKNVHSQKNPQHTHTKKNQTQNFWLSDIQMFF